MIKSTPLTSINTKLGGFLISLSFVLPIFLLVFHLTPLVSAQSNFSDFSLQYTNVRPSTSTVTQLNDLSFSFQTIQAVPNGSFEILIPAASASAAAADGTADRQGFDFAQSTISCPDSILGVFDFAEPTATSAAESQIIIDGQNYHAYACTYTGTGEANIDFTVQPLMIHQLVNPLPPSNLSSNAKFTVGPIIFRQLSAEGVIQESNLSQINFFTADQIAAADKNSTASPVNTAQISFKIDGVPAQTPACGQNTDTTTQAHDVAFEDIAPFYFKNAAQRLTVSTDAAYGYTTTVIAADQMGLNGDACGGQDAIGNRNCIPDVTANNATHLQPGAWYDATTQKGFGYTLQKLTADGTVTSPNTFDFSQGYKQFADRSASEAPVPILRNSAATSGDEIYVCYRVIPPDDTTPGKYESNIMYTITATF